MVQKKSTKYDALFAQREGFQTYLSLAQGNENFEVPEDFKAALDAVIALIPDGNQKNPISHDHRQLLELIHIVQVHGPTFGQALPENQVGEQVSKQLQILIEAAGGENSDFICKSQGLLGQSKPPTQADVDSERTQKLVKSYYGKLPLYLALSCEATKDMKKELNWRSRKIVNSATSELIKDGNMSTMSKADFSSMFRITEGHEDFHRFWRKPASHHIMQLFMTNKAYLASPIHHNFEENVEVSVVVKAVLYVPNCIFTAVCFPVPDKMSNVVQPIDHEIPHMTLFHYGKWQATLSNRLLL